MQITQNPETLDGRGSSHFLDIQGFSKLLSILGGSRMEFKGRCNQECNQETDWIFQPVTISGGCQSRVPVHPPDLISSPQCEVRRFRLHLVCLNLAPPKNDRLPIQCFNERSSKDWWIQAIHPESSIRYLFWTSKSPRVALRYHGYR